MSLAPCPLCESRVVAHATAIECVNCRLMMPIDQINDNPFSDAMEKWNSHRRLTPLSTGNLISVLRSRYPQWAEILGVFSDIVEENDCLGDMGEDKDDQRLRAALWASLGARAFFRCYPGVRVDVQRDIESQSFLVAAYLRDAGDRIRMYHSRMDLRAAVYRHRYSGDAAKVFADELARCLLDLDSVIRRDFPSENAGLMDAMQGLTATDLFG